jgi:predicted sulfurtransferase
VRHFISLLHQGFKNVFQLEGGIMPNKSKEENIESNSWKELCFRPQTGEEYRRYRFLQCRHQCGENKY